MRHLPRLLLAAVAATAACATFTTFAADAPSPAWDGDRLRFPAEYRQWIYLTTGFDMSYAFSMAKMGHHMFDNVFVTPEAWAAFQKTGTWPDHTVVMIEARRAGDKASINKDGHFQTDDVMGYEFHVKDQARHGGDGWAFYTFDDPATPAQRLHAGNDCDACHQAHGAVDSTFVQFYPTLLPIAKAKGTLAPAYVAEESKRR